MAVEANIQASAKLVPRHYVLALQAAIPPAAMVELMQAFTALETHPHTEGLFEEDRCGGVFVKLRTACAEAYTGDLPQPISAPIQPGGDEGDDEGGVAART